MKIIIEEAALNYLRKKQRSVLTLEIQTVSGG